MSVAKVLVIDDSVLVRKVVTSALDGQPGITVVGTASNGRIGLQRIALLEPNLVILDISMPEMDGLAALAKIREHYPFLPVLLFSSPSESHTKASFEGLEKGASDYVEKPSGKLPLDETILYLRRELGPRIIALVKGGSPPSSTLPAPSSVTPLKPFERHRKIAPRVLAVGASTGGPQALTEFLLRLGKDISVPVVITQHMPAGFTRLLAERLSSQCDFPVREAQGGEILMPGVALLAPGDFHLTFDRRLDGSVVAVLSSAPPENSCRPAVDPMLRSLVKIFEGGVITVVLTGMGRDGYRGAEHVAAAGGTILVQDEATSVVWGMPGYIAKSRLADGVYPIDRLAHEVRMRLGTTRFPAKKEVPA